METQVLQNWQPSKLDKVVISKEFSEILSQWFLVFDVRILSNDDAPHPHVKEWHDDEGLAYTVIWANKHPTEVVFLRNQTLLETRDGDVILLNNLESRHRTPPSCPLGRWIAWAEVKPKGESKHAIH